MWQGAGRTLGAAGPLGQLAARGHRRAHLPQALQRADHAAQQVLAHAACRPRGLDGHVERAPQVHRPLQQADQARQLACFHGLHRGARAAERAHVRPQGCAASASGVRALRPLDAATRLRTHARPPRTGSGAMLVLERAPPRTSSCCSTAASSWPRPIASFSATARDSPQA